MPRKATAQANSNIAFIKYWGLADSTINLPLTSSISMTLDTLHTTTTVEFDPSLGEDVVVIDDRERQGDPLRRARRHLDRLRRMAGVQTRARIVSRNNFPMAAGIASSASAFAALTVAAADALELDLDFQEMSRLARLESGSASRSLYGGFVEWQAGEDDAGSYALPIAGEGHWELRDVVAVVAAGHKKVSSAEGHLLASTSPFLQSRLDEVDKQLPRVREAILSRDLNVLGELIETDTLAMHFVMMTSRPRLFYWAPATITLMQRCQEWRAQGLNVYFTIDAGPNVHLICEAKQEADLIGELRAMEGIREILTSGPGPGPQLLDDHLV